MLSVHIGDKTLQVCGYASIEYLGERQSVSGLTGVSLCGMIFELVHTATSSRTQWEKKRRRDFHIIYYVQ